MATREELKQVFANRQMATGEKFANLIDSMKVVQLPVVDPQALGTSLTFIDSISQDADGKITPTKKTLDLANAHELNPFKGWYKTGDTLPTDGFDGAYLYFKDTSELTGQTTIYRWNGTAYADTGTVVDTSNVQTFASGQAVNGVAIDGTGLANPASNALAKAEDAMLLAQKLANIELKEDKVTVTQSIIVDGYINENGVPTTYSTTKSLLIGVEGYDNVRFLGLVRKSSVSIPNYCCFYSDAEGSQVIGVAIPLGFNTVDEELLKEFILQIPEGAMAFRCNYVSSSTAPLDSNFYCYLQKGLTVEQAISKMNQKPHRKGYNYWIGKRIRASNRVIQDKKGWNIGYVKIPASDTSTVVKFKFGFGNIADNDLENMGTGLVFLSSPNYPLMSSSSYYYSYTGYNEEREITFSASDSDKHIYFSFYDYYKGSKNTKPLIIDGVPIDLESMEYIIDEEGWKDYPVGKLVNSDINTTSADLQASSTYDPIRVASYSKTVVPMDKAKMRVILNDNSRFIFCNVYCTNSKGIRVSLVQSPLNGIRKSFDFNENAKCIRFSFLEPNKIFLNGVSGEGTHCKELSHSEIEEMIASGKLLIQYYVGNEKDVIERNNDKNEAITTAKRNKTNRDFSAPIIGHISDLHGDAVRLENFMQYMLAKNIPIGISTGDVTMYKHSDKTEFQDAIAKKYVGLDYLFCIGNHESTLTGTSGTGSTVTTLFTDNIAELATQYNYLASDGVTTTKCYYYKDYDTQKMRIIALNQYEDGVYNGRLTQSQMEWFVDTLATTPEGYGVIVMLHSPERKVVTQGYDKFRQQTPNTGESYQPYGFYVKGKPISAIVDAFISKSSGSVTFYDHASDYTGNSNTGFLETGITIDYDFTQVASGVEFIAYLCGHRHEDWIGYYEKEDNDTDTDNRGVTLLNNQLVLLPTCGNAMYGDSSNPAWANQSDIARGGEGVSQDCFNVYTIDRNNHVVNIVRIGATLTNLMTKRDMMIIPYN